MPAAAHTPVQQQRPPHARAHVPATLAPHTTHHAPRKQVKEAFRRLVWQYHPDKVAPEARVGAEAKFKEVRRRAPRRGGCGGAHKPWCGVGGWSAAAGRVCTDHPHTAHPLARTHTRGTQRATHTTQRAPCGEQVKLAYEAILQREAGYSPPPPGSAPSSSSAQTYWHTHSRDGRVPWGKYAGARARACFRPRSR
jgi:hypothetical protein